MSIPTNHSATCRKELPILELTCFSNYKRKDGSITKSYHCRDCRHNHVDGWNKSPFGRKYKSERSKLQNKQNPVKYLARIKLSKAVIRGEIEKLPCTKCGADNHIEAHHEDYSKPLEVMWLCRSHHYELHKLKRLQLI